MFSFIRMYSGVTISYSNSTCSVLYGCNYSEYMYIREYCENVGTDIIYA